MLFSSIVFLFTFLPVTLLVYYLVPGRLKNIVLLLASLVFYAWGEPVYVILMVLSILFNYVSGIDIERNLENPFKAKQSLVIAGSCTALTRRSTRICAAISTALRQNHRNRKIHTDTPRGTFQTGPCISCIVHCIGVLPDIQIKFIVFRHHSTSFISKE